MMHTVKEIPMYSGHGTTGGIKTTPSYEVGIYIADIWHHVAKTGDLFEAMRFCNYLNGGEGKSYPIEPVKETLRVV